MNKFKDYFNCVDNYEELPTSIKSILEERVDYRDRLSSRAFFNLFRNVDTLTMEEFEKSTGYKIRAENFALIKGTWFTIHRNLEKLFVSKAN